MKNLRIEFLTSFLFIFLFPLLNIAQDDLDFELTYKIQRVQSDRLIANEKSIEAETLADLDRWFKPNQVQKYQSVEMVATVQGKTKTEISKSNILTSEQKELIQMADAATEISVTIKYLPKNNLKENEVKVWDFAFTVEPQNEAKFKRGQQQLKSYIKENAMDKISNDVFKKYNLTAVKFTVNEEGAIVDSKIFESSRNETVDKILLETICNMPTWTPAEYTNGKKISQQFVLTVGDMNSCVINLLRIPQE